MGRTQDRRILRDNESWARQVVEHTTLTAVSGGHHYFHHQTQGPHRNAAAARRTMNEAYQAAATLAGPEGRIVVMVGHGSGGMCDLAPAPHLRVDMEIIRAANNFEEGTPGFGTEAEALLNLRAAIGGRVRELYLATCNLARGTGPSFLRSLGLVLRGGADVPILYGLDGFLWSNVEEGRTVMGVTTDRAARPVRVYADELWTSHWYRERPGGGVP